MGAAIRNKLTCRSGSSTDTCMSKHEGMNFVQFMCTISKIWFHRNVAPTGVYNRSKCQRDLINIPGGMHFEYFPKICFIFLIFLYSVKIMHNNENLAS